MGFLSDLFEDILETTDKVIRSPLRTFCAIDDHMWEWSFERDQYVCSTCGATVNKEE